ncbi:hypothetical protein TNCV_4551471 [Trichonephila clavipes]|nr:hypothetical protein TNCV_4551471 [Trichonephila clavipes]
MLPVLGKKAVLEWCMKEGLIGSSYVYPKCGKSMELRERMVDGASRALLTIPSQRNYTRAFGDRPRNFEPWFSWGMLNGAPSPTGALISYLIMTSRCHFAVLARMVEVITIKALGSARSPTKRDNFHTVR